MIVPFVKAHGASNDFLLTWRAQLPTALAPDAIPSAAVAICNRHTGVGADGWLLMEDSQQADAAMRSYVQQAAGSGPSDELTKLAALRDQGVLTDEEFAAQKAKLLA